MKPDARFVKQPKHFWANVRSISQRAGYTNRKTKQIKVYSIAAMCNALAKCNLIASHILGSDSEPTELGQTLVDYFEYRADVLNNYVEPRLMNAKQAKAAFAKPRRRLPKASCPLPMNKQKSAKRAPAYLTCMINMLIEENAGEFPCNYDPKALTTATLGDMPLRTLARRVDGAFPSSVNPVAIWEIKEYYYTTTFGSRVADGVYETLLDGMELEELREQEKIDIRHYLMVDAHYTWWECGRSYLCRILDMLHMGYIDEALFGGEVLEQLPRLVKEWVAEAKQRKT